MLTTLSMMNFEHAVLMQALTLIGAGLAVGTVIGRRVAVTELP